MSDQDFADSYEDFALNAEDIVQIIPLDDDDTHPDSDSDEGGDGQMEIEEEEEEGAAAASAPPVDQAELIFTGHKDAVFTVRVEPKSCTHAVTGGQDDKAIVWDMKTGNTLFEVTGHKDSVTSVGWSSDGKYVATADLSGVIKVWQVNTKAEVWSFEAGDVEWLQWHPGAPVLLVGTVDGECWMWKIPAGDCKTFTGHGPGCLCGVVMQDGKRVCMGYEDGVVKVWDLKSGTVFHTYSGHDGHKSSVVCLDAHSDNSMLITGSTDMTAMVLNTTVGKVLSTYDCSNQHGGGSGEEDNSVESVGLSPVMNYAATGTLGGVLSVWDISTHVTRHQCTHPEGIVKLKWSQTAPVVYSACLDGVVRLWDARSGKEENRWTGHSAAILDFDITDNGESLVTVCEDHTARIFSIHLPDS